MFLCVCVFVLLLFLFWFLFFQNWGGCRFVGLLCLRGLLCDFCWFGGCWLGLVGDGVQVFCFFVL